MKMFLVTIGIQILKLVTNLMVFDAKKIVSNKFDTKKFLSNKIRLF